jgi:hypothetical protein
MAGVTYEEALQVLELGERIRAILGVAFGDVVLSCQDSQVVVVKHDGPIVHRRDLQRLRESSG